MSFFVELKRRNVFRVGIAYLVASWLLLQLTEVLTELLEIGPEVGKIVIVLLIIGFVPALIFAWAFEMTPEGLKREHEVDRSQSITPQTGRKLDRVVIGMLVVIAGYFIWESRFMDKGGVATGPVAVTDTAPAAQAPPPSTEKPSQPADERTSIVVLPFINMSNDPEQEYFSDGLSEEILNALVKIRELRVISRTSAFAFKGKDVSIPEIAAQLDVSHVLEGSVRKAGNDVRITAQLIEVATDSHLWSDAYNRSLENVFEIQEEISQAIADELQVTLGAGDAGERPTDNLEAYQLFLRGRHHYQARGLDNMQTARRLLEQAVALDPAFDEAWANLAAATTIESFYVQEGFRELNAQSLEAARKAIAINPENGFAHAVIGLRAFGDLDYEKAVEALKTAIELGPNESNSYLWMAIVLSSLGYIDQAIETLETAETFDPVFTNLQNWLVSLHLAAGDLVAAREQRARVTALDPDYDLNEAGSIELMDGNFDAAEAEHLKAVASFPASEPAVRAMYMALREPGRQAEAVEIIQAHRETGGYYSVFSLLYRIGAVEQAIAEWQRMRAAGRGLRAANNIGALWQSYDRDKLSHPAIPAFLESIGLADYWRAHGNPDYCRVTATTVECVTK